MPTRDAQAAEIIDEARRLFGDETRPAHFTDYRHCCECAEHDETLRSSTPDELACDDVRPGWDPICFITPPGFRYYFPALVRLAVHGAGDEYFVDQLVFHLEYDGLRNSRYLAFSPEQRQFVVRVLNYLVEKHAAEIEQNGDADALFRAIDIWSASE